MAGAYYNEVDPFAAQWLRNLIRAGHIAPGDVDERPIQHVHPVDVIGYRQCHWFAGIGVWSYALRQAGWEDDRDAWTGSCPCQPFSSAGRRKGFSDDRHLWPHWLPLIAQRRPAIVFGEQVSSAADWLCVVRSDLEILDYAVGAIPFEAASVGAPHKRDRFYFVAYSGSSSSGRDAGAIPRAQAETEWALRSVAHGSGVSRAARDMANAEIGGYGRGWSSETRTYAPIEFEGFGSSIDLAHASSTRWPEGWAGSGNGCVDRCSAAGELGDASRSGRSGVGFWADAEWIPCTDGKARPIEPGTFPLATGVAGRVGRLRAYGNALNAEQAAAFIETARECVP